MMYLSFYDAIEELTTEEKGLLLDAIFKYQAGANIPELPKTAKIVFSIMSKQFDRDAIKYQEKVVNRNRLNGKEGGRPRKNPDEPKKPNGFSDNPKNLDNDNVDDTVNDTVNDDDDVTVIDTDVSEIFDFYRSSSSNFMELVLDNYLINHTTKMLKKHGKGQIKAAIQAAAESWYCNGFNEKKYRADLLWILDPKYFERLISGYYRNRGEYPEYDQNGNKMIPAKIELFKKY